MHQNAVCVERPFAVAGFGHAVVMPAELSFSAGCISDIWWGIVETIVSAMSFMMSCFGVPVRKEDSEFARRMGVLLQEMEVAYNERAYFIKELEVVSGVDAVVKTAEFLNDALWKDERRLQRLRKLRMDADLMACEKEKEITEDLRLAREINALCARVTAIVDEREMFVDELDMLAGKHVPDKMVEFMKQVQGKDIPNLMKLQILKREFELRAQEKGIFIKKLKGNLDFLILMCSVCLSCIRCVEMVSLV
ncbi:hypothetical protein Tco_0719369 [Tanacetum coccineum]